MSVNTQSTATTATPPTAAANPMDTAEAAYWKTVHIITIIVTVLLLIYEISVYSISSAPLRIDHLLVSVLLIALTVGLAWRIYPFAMLFLCVWSVMAFLPTFNGAAFIITVYSCIVIILVNCSGKQLFLSLFIPLIVFASTVGVTAYRAVIPALTLRRGVVEIVINLFLVALVGILFRSIQHRMQLRVQAAQLQTEKQRAEQLERNVRLASQMHDGLTNDLSYIATLAYSHVLQEQAAVSKDDGAQGTAQGVAQGSAQQQAPSDWQHVYEEAQAALDKAHFAIDRLRGKPEAIDEIADARGPLKEVLPRIAAREKAKLDALGFSGTLDVDLAHLPDSVSASARSEAVQLVTELFANIRRHASDDGTYSVSLHYAPDFQAVKIVAMNTLSSASRGGNSGRGLLLHHHILQNMGGAMETSEDDGVWILRATIPLATR